MICSYECSFTARSSECLLGLNSKNARSARSRVYLRLLTHRNFFIRRTRAVQFGNWAEEHFRRVLAEVVQIYHGMRDFLMYRLCFLTFCLCIFKQNCWYSVASFRIWRREKGKFRGSCMWSHVDGRGQWKCMNEIHVSRDNCDGNRFWERYAVFWCSLPRKLLHNT